MFNKLYVLFFPREPIKRMWAALKAPSYNLLLRCRPSFAMVTGDGRGERCFSIYSVHAAADFEGSL